MIVIKLFIKTKFKRKQMFCLTNILMTFLSTEVMGLVKTPGRRHLDFLDRLHVPPTLQVRPRCCKAALQASAWLTEYVLYMQKTLVAVSGTSFKTTPAKSSNMKSSSWIVQVFLTSLVTGLAEPKVWFGIWQLPICFGGEQRGDQNVFLTDWSKKYIKM